MSRLKLFTTNVGSVLMSRVAGNLLSFVTLPLFVSYFGGARYGIFILAMSITPSLALFDFGTKNALVRYTAEYMVDKDVARYNTAVAGSVIMAGALGIVLSLIVFGLSFVAESAFNIDAESASEAIEVFQLAALYTFVFVVARVSQSVLEGHQLFYWQSINQFLALAVNLTVFFVVKYLGLSFLHFAALMMLGRLVPGVLNTVVVIRKKLLHGVSLRQGLSGKIVGTEFFHYSANLFVLQFIAFGAFQADKFVIGGILSTAAVTIYIVVTKPMYLIRMVSNQTLTVLAPALAETNRSGDDRRLNSIMRRGNLALAILVFPMVALVVVFIQHFIDLWIGGVYSEYAFWGGVASLTFLFSPFYGIAIKILHYTGKITIVRNVNFWAVLLNLTVSIVGTFYFGFGGVIIGSLIQAVIQVPIFFRVMKAERGLGISDLIPGLFWINAAFVTLAGAVLFFAVREFNLNGWWEFLVALGISTAILYSFGVWIMLKHQLLSRDYA